MRLKFKKEERDLFPPSEAKVKYEIMNRKLEKKKRRSTRRLILNVFGLLVGKKGHFTTVSDGHFLM